MSDPRDSTKTELRVSKQTSPGTSPAEVTCATTSFIFLMAGWYYVTRLDPTCIAAFVTSFWLMGAMFYLSFKGSRDTSQSITVNVIPHQDDKAPKADDGVEINIEH